MTAASERRFRPSAQVHSRQFDDEMVLLDLVRGEYFALNSLGATIWENISKGVSVNEIVARVLEVYEIDAQTARNDVETMVERLVAAGLLEACEWP